MLLPSIDLLPGIFSGMAPASCRPLGILINLKSELALPVSEYTAIVCRPFAQRDACTAEAARRLPLLLHDADRRKF
jgi:hypothetical protein